MTSWIAARRVAPGDVTPEALEAFAGWVAELLIYSKALDDATERQVEDYLRRRYFAAP